MALTKTQEKVVESVGGFGFLFVVAFLSPIPLLISIPFAFIIVFSIRIKSEVELEEKVKKLEQANETLSSEIRQLRAEIDKHNEIDSSLS